MVLNSSCNLKVEISRADRQVKYDYPISDTVLRHLNILLGFPQDLPVHLYTIVLKELLYIIYLKFRTESGYG